ncbi:MAG: hypothetical protein F4Z87_04470, partial [Gammaproteobacteria bacterium]|nr:hypothetical protein [Gammaproteobacteria bacterium]
MSHFYHAPRWLWGAGIGLALTVVAVVCVLWVTQKQAATTPTALEINEPRAVIPAMLPTTEPAVTVVAPPAPLPHIDFQPGSVEEACGLNELPPYWIGDGSRERNTDLTNAFESDECQIALEKHMNALNPYHYIFSGAWGTGKIILMKLVVLDDPLTFAQVFADPVGDSARVQEAFSRPECLLKGEEKNWELNESCHADALLNYALINTLCFNRSGSRVIRVNRAYYPPEDNPTSAQDRLMWKEEFEDAWVRAKCESLDAELQLHSDRFPALYE